ncbi:threonine synthase [Rhodocytophaga rosea]|uniref:Threonine synthase n=1 Tax=Rhodocytophaga rosea TaxID=2704465 RepID=A0A6C0GSD6_9BACT|nr:threonine synthase [Rhodocytophaga rosea]QHT71008.1 threonine synthase [Rhodocytophaga rosea]
MNYYSTNKQIAPVSFNEAVISGLAPDKGLFMPEQIPVLSQSFIQSLPDLSFVEIATEVASHFIGQEIPEKDLQTLIADAFNFDIPLVELREDLHILELFHGPTLAFKDVGARFMSRIMAYFLRNVGQKVYVLVATSGDTGSAVAQGFYKVPGIDVVILYPSGKVSKVQEVQFTTLGENITALEVNGTFDDCQRLVKTAFADVNLRNKLYLTSANSINIARLLPQSFYYFYAYAQLRRKYKGPVVFSVPSGNYGNLTAGLFAQRMGLPVHHFIAASNSNDTVPLYLQKGTYLPKPSVATISNAMDVGDPSNFARMSDLFGNSLPSMQQQISGYSLSDAETRNAMKEMRDKFQYTIDPHGAVAYKAFETYKANGGEGHGIILATAHPAKFGDVVESAIGKQPILPEQLATLLNKPKKSIPMSNSFEGLKEFLMSNA